MVKQQMRIPGIAESVARYPCHTILSQPNRCGEAANENFRHSRINCQISMAHYIISAQKIWRSSKWEFQAQQNQLPDSHATLYHLSPTDMLKQQMRILGITESIARYPCHTILSQSNRHGEAANENSMYNRINCQISMSHYIISAQQMWQSSKWEFQAEQNQLPDIHGTLYYLSPTDMVKQQMRIPGIAESIARYPCQTIFSQPNRYGEAANENPGIAESIARYPCHTNGLHSYYQWCSQGPSVRSPALFWVL